MNMVQERGVTHPVIGASPCVTLRHPTPERRPLHQIAAEATLPIAAVLLQLARHRHASCAQRGLPFFLSPVVAGVLLGVTSESLQVALKTEGADTLACIERQARGLERLVVRKERGGEHRLVAEAAPAPKVVVEAWLKLRPAGGDTELLCAALRRAQEPAPVPVLPRVAARPPAAAEEAEEARVQSREEAPPATTHPPEVFARRFVAVDVETTADTEQRITEIALVTFEDGEVVDRRVTLVNPEQRIPWRATQITGIDDAMVRGAPTFARLAARLAARLEGQVVVAHNLAFDRSRITAELERVGLSWPGVAGEVCTDRLYRALHGKKGKSGLGLACERYGVALERHHRAEGDAEACGRLLLAMRGRLKAP